MASATDPADWIDVAARHHAQHVFATTPAGERCTYGELRERSGRVAAALIKRGVVPGDRVAAQVDKSLDAVLLYVACLRMGAAFVPINVANTPNEVDYFLRDSHPRIAILRPVDHGTLAPIARAAGVEHVETLGPAGEGSWHELVRESAELPQLPAAPGATALAAIVYTSGTTGRSKGAMLTRGNLASNAVTLAHAWRFSPADVLMHTLPLFHVHGLFAAINTVLASASSLLLMPKFDADAVIAHLPDATVYMGVPTHYTRLLQHADLARARTAAMRLFVSGSAPLLAETHRAFEERTGHLILERFGMTETLMNTSNPYDGRRVAGSVGPALPGIGVRTVDTENGPVLSNSDTVGMLEISGPNVFAGYWQDPEKTRAEFTADGWFKTGDLGRIDADGYVYIVGRAKDLVISGGYNVYPKEVESELDAIAGVFESAVFGVPHPDFGEAVTAAVVRHAGAVICEAELISAVQSRLARYKVPKRILLVDELPRNAMGKVQKNVLRATYGSLYR